MRLILLTLLSLLSFSISAQDFVLAKTVGNVSQHAGVGNLASDEAGNIYATGYFTNICHFDQTVISAPGENAFIAKYNAAGQVIWVKTILSNDLVESHRLIYRHGRIYITGLFEGTVQLDAATSFTEPNTVFSHFLACYDTSGSLVWAKDLPSSVTPLYPRLGINQMCFDPQGNLLLAGEIYAPYSSAFVTITDTVYGAIVIKADSLGNVTWHKEFPAYFYCTVMDLASDPSGNVLFTGNFGNSLYNGQYFVASLNDTLRPLCAACNHDVFLVKLDNNGNYVWNIQPTDASMISNAAGGVCTDPAGNIILQTSPARNFIGNSGSCLQKFDASGTIIWNILTPGYDPWSFVRSDANGNIYEATHLRPDTTVYGNDTILGGNCFHLTARDNNGAIRWQVQSNPGADPERDLTLDFGLFNDLQTNFSVADNGKILVPGMLLGGMGFGNHFLQTYYHSTAFWVVISDTAIASAGSDQLSGIIFNDTNGNCLQDPGENGIAGQTVLIQPGGIYCSTDTDGMYHAHLSAGTYSVTQLLPSTNASQHSQNCPAANASYYVTLPGTGIDTSGFDFADQLQACPLPSIEITDYGLNNFLCGEIVRHTIGYFNYGDDTLHNAVITLQQSHALIPLSSSPAWTSYTVSDSTVTISLGDILPHSFDTASITDSIDCNFIQVWTMYDFLIHGKISPPGCFPADSVYAIEWHHDSFFVPIGMTSNGVNKTILFPNPATDEITIRNSAGESGMKVVIYSLAGELIFSEDYSGNEAKIGLGNFAAGTYLVAITDNHGNCSRTKLVVTR